MGTGKVLPAGILREPVKRIREADMVVVTKAGEPDPDFEGFLADVYGGPIFWTDYRRNWKKPPPCKSKSSTVLPTHFHNTKP